MELPGLQRMVLPMLCPVFCPVVDGVCFGCNELVDSADAGAGSVEPGSIMSKRKNRNIPAVDQLCAPDLLHMLLSHV